VNPGTISHNELLDLYKLYVDSQFTYTNFTVEEQDRILKARRSNNELDTTKLKKEFPELLPIQQSIHSVFQKMAAQQALIHLSGRLISEKGVTFPKKHLAN